MFRILIAEDDQQQRKDLEGVLHRAGYEPMGVENGIQALEMLERKMADLLLLDIQMPQMDGLELLKQLRGGGCDIPVLILSERGDVKDRCLGLRLGADDYMGKPADEEELTLRIHALLRRAHRETQRELTVGKTTLHYDSFSLVRDGQQIMVPRKEFLLLYKLLSNPGKTFTRRQLMDELWEPDTQSNEHTLVVHVNRLRDRIGENPDFTILTTRGLGYRAVCRE